MRFGGLQAGELGQVRDLLDACGLPATDLDADAVRYFIGAWDADVLAGVVGLQPLGHLGLLRSLAVAPEHRGEGIGARLCDEVESLARAGSLSELYLLTTTASTYFAARGFHVCPRESLPGAVRDTAQFRELCPATAVAMHKPLPPLA